VTFENSLQNLGRYTRFKTSHVFVLNSVGDVPRIVLTFPVQQPEGRLPLQRPLDDVTLPYAVLPPADPEVVASSLQNMRDYVT
jgi:hypothetical protein